MQMELDVNAILQHIDGTGFKWHNHYLNQCQPWPSYYDNKQRNG